MAHLTTWLSRAMTQCMGQGGRREEGGGEVWRLMRLELSDGALDYLAKRGYDPVYGARCEGGGWER